MKYFKILVVSLFLTGVIIPSLTFAGRVGGYYRSSGNYVQPYYRTNPNSYKYDNYSTYGNYNPYSSKYGTRKYYSW